MIDYSLAKQLKEAGFSQDYHGGNGSGFFYDGDEWGVFVYCPTLSELIEACGDGFRGLDRTLNSEWVAKGYDFKTTFAATPEEAVTNLWLELQKK